MRSDLFEKTVALRASNKAVVRIVRFDDGADWLLTADGVEGDDTLDLSLIHI